MRAAIELSEPSRKLLRAVCIVDKCARKLMPGNEG